MAGMNKGVSRAMRVSDKVGGMGKAKKAVSEGADHYGAAKKASQAGLKINGRLSTGAVGKRK